MSDVTKDGSYAGYTTTVTGSKKALIELGCGKYFNCNFKTFRSMKYQLDN